MRSGLARSYGFKAALPGLTSSRIEVEKLQQFEDEAKRDQIGAWGVKAGRLNAHAQAPSAFSSFVPMERLGPAQQLRVRLRFFSNRKTRHVNYAQFSRGEWIARERKNFSWEHRHQYRNRKRADNRARNRARDGGAHYCRAAFRNANDLKRVSGIGEKKYAQVRPYFR